jgi:hypothetical protein
VEFRIYARSYACAYAYACLRRVCLREYVRCLKFEVGGPSNYLACLPTIRYFKSLGLLRLFPKRTILHTPLPTPNDVVSIIPPLRIHHLPLMSPLDQLQHHSVIQQKQPRRNH